MANFEEMSIVGIQQTNIHKTVPRVIRRHLDVFYSKLFYQARRRHLILDSPFLRLQSIAELSLLPRTVTSEGCE